MNHWDVFHAESLELERGQSGDAIRAALASGALHEDDLVRPAGSTAAGADRSSPALGPRWVAIPLRVVTCSCAGTWIRNATSTST